jgi:hypothetical protein
MKPQGDDVLDWLLAGDAAIRWQVHRDLLGSSARAVSKERQQVELEGWGARLLELQDAGGTWGKGLYTPKWTSTTYTLLLLRDLGLPAQVPAARRPCQLLLDGGFCSDGGVGYPAGRSETCITGMVLAILAYFQHDDQRLDAIAAHLLEQQLPDGGWNCRRWRGATHSSVHTTISALEALHGYEQQRRRRKAEVRAAQARGREFLLAHRLFRSHRTGAVIKPAFKQLVFPPRWHYDILRALDYFRATGAERDERLTEGIDLLRAKAGADGRWLLENVYRGQTFFELERRGKPSRWNTLRALRVLRWWDGPAPRRASRS